MTSSRTGGLVLAAIALIFVSLLSIAVGARSIPLSTVVHELFARGSSDASYVVWSLRIPRTLIGIAVGAALGVAGALMQALTRNPLADPGLLGVNGGAAYGPDVPFGGYKASGVGRQNGYAGFDQYLEVKSLAWPAG